MNAGLLAQYTMNGLMLGMMYALVAVGFTLFFGVLDVIKFSHGDVLTVGAFAALATFAGLQGIGLRSAWLDLIIMLAVAILAMAFLGMLIARYLVMPLRSAPPLNQGPSRSGDDAARTRAGSHRGHQGADRAAVAGDRL